MGLWVSCGCQGAALAPLKRCAAGALLPPSPRPGQSLCVGDGSEHSAPARPCCSTDRPRGRNRSAPLCVCVGGGVFPPLFHCSPPPPLIMRGLPPPCLGRFCCRFVVKRWPPPRKDNSNRPLPNNRLRGCRPCTAHTASFKYPGPHAMPKTIAPGLETERRHIRIRASCTQPYTHARGHRVRRAGGTLFSATSASSGTALEQTKVISQGPCGRNGCHLCGAGGPDLLRRSTATCKLQAHPARCAMVVQKVQTPHPSFLRHRPHFPPKHGNTIRKRHRMLSPTLYPPPPHTPPQNDRITKTIPPKCSPKPPFKNQNPFSIGKRKNTHTQFCATCSRTASGPLWEATTPVNKWQRIGPGGGGVCTCHVFAGGHRRGSNVPLCVPLCRSHCPSKSRAKGFRFVKSWAASGARAVWQADPATGTPPFGGIGPRDDAEVSACGALSRRGRARAGARGRRDEGGGDAEGQTDGGRRMRRTGAGGRGRGACDAPAREAGAPSGGDAERGCSGVSAHGHAGPSSVRSAAGPCPALFAVPTSVGRRGDPREASVLLCGDDVLINCEGTAARAPRAGAAAAQGSALRASSTSGRYCG